MKVWILGLFVSCSLLYGQSVNTTLTKPEEISIFLEATNRIRCICLPSIPIQSCSYNMCVVSSYLKTFIENRVREGRSAEEIVSGFQNGFHDSVDWDKDSVIQHFQEEGNDAMIYNLQNGFGDKILARPDSFWINATLFGFTIFAFVGLYFFWKKGKKEPIVEANSEPNKPNLEKYLKEIE